MPTTDPIFWILPAAILGIPLLTFAVILFFGIWLGLQAFINIGVNMGALPTKGLTLPLISYGRSSLLVTLAWLGMVLRIYHECAPANRPAMTRAGQTLGRPASAGARA